MKSDAVQRVVIAGGSGVVSKAIEEELKAAGKKVVRLAGVNRYLTSAEVVKWAIGKNTEAEFQPDVLLSLNNMGVATGRNFADALASVDLLGRTGGVLLLVADNTGPNKEAFETNVAELIAPNKLRMKAGYIFGGSGAVSKAIEEALNAAVERN
jgi:putative cell wall-binding protein